MTEQEKQADLLRKAEDAEQRAATASIPAAKEAWKRIAEKYRELAKAPPQTKTS